MAEDERPLAVVATALEVLPVVLRIVRQAAAGGEAALTLTQFRILKLLGRGGATVTQLAAALEVTPATASTAVAGLVRRGLVERRAPGSDRRSVPLGRTAAGDAAVAAARGRQQDVLAALAADLRPGERRALAVGLRGLMRVLPQPGNL